MSQKYAIQIVTQKDDEGFTVVTSIHAVAAKSKNIRNELKFLEYDYAILVKSLKNVMALVSKSKKVDVRLYWIGADTLLDFLNRIDDLGFYLLKQNKTLGRDTGLSDSTVQKMLAFRKRFPKISLVNPSYSWAKYRANKVPVPSPNINKELSVRAQ